MIATFMKQLLATTLSVLLVLGLRRWKFPRSRLGIQDKARRYPATTCNNWLRPLRCTRIRW